MSEEKQEKKTFVGVVKDIFDWYPSHYPEEERKFLRKLDCSIMIFACLCFFTKFLDQTNITNAYVSGMKEELNLNGNELNYFTTSYFATYVAFQIPLLLVISRPQYARWALPTLEVIWGILTFVQSRVTSAGQLYAIRAMIGAAEAPVFAGVHFILGSWYRGPELFKRAGVWFLCNSLGTMFSGYLQAAAYTNLNGVGGMAGWRWLFIIDGVITVPIALVGFFVFPGVPESPRPFYISEEEIALGKRRMADYNAKPAGKLNLAVLRRTFGRWHWYIFVLAYICMINTTYPSQYMALWLKAEGYSVVQINNLPTVTSAISVISSWIGTTLAGIVPSWIIFGIATGAAIFGTVCLTIWNIPTALKFVAYYIFGLGGCSSPILYSTINVILKGDTEERALVMSSMMTIGYSTTIWVPLLLYPTVDAPQWKTGMPAGIGFNAGLYACFIAALVLWRRDKRREKLARGELDTSDASSREEHSIGDSKTPVAVGSETTKITRQR